MAYFGVIFFANMGGGGGQNYFQGGWTPFCAFLLFFCEKLRLYVDSSPVQRSEKVVGPDDASVDRGWARSETRQQTRWTTGGLHLDIETYHPQTKQVDLKQTK